jgi:hypothetical protein
LNDRILIPSAIVALALTVGTAACRVDAGGMNTGFSASANAIESRSESQQTVSTIGPSTPVQPAQPAHPARPAQPAQPKAAPPPGPPPADACPLTCFEARGPVSASLTTEEHTQLRSALEPVLGRMRSCVSAEDWRSHGSPVIHLRIGADGSLTELGVDPEHGLESSCFEDAARGASPGLSLPGRKAVRCVERCVREARPRPGRRSP